MKKILTTMTMIGSMVAGLNAQTIVSGNITSDTTWGNAANPSPIILDGAVFVKGNSELTILAGTIVRGQPRTAAAAPGVTLGTPGALIVTQGSKIIAEGSASSPIIFTTAAVDNVAPFGVPDDVVDINGNPGADGFLDAWTFGDTFLDATPATAPLAPLNKRNAANVGLITDSNISLWGSLVILGKAPTNLAEATAVASGVNYGQGLVEGLIAPGFPTADATYGGVLPHDNSGVLKFVSIRHAGDELGEGNELNGITLAGVGDGTIIENVEVYCNFDDGFEWFGGTVNGKYLSVSFAGDDQFDMDQGYTGINQFLFAVMPFFNENDGEAFGSRSGDKGCEWDGDDSNLAESVVADTDIDLNFRIPADVTSATVDTTPWPLSNPYVANLTILGSSPDVDGAVDFTVASAASDNRGVQMRHGFAGQLWNSIVVNTGTEEGLEVRNDSEETTTPGNTTLDNAAAGLVIVADSTFADVAAMPAGSSTALANGDAITGSGFNNGNRPSSALELNKEDTTFDPTGDASGKLNSSLKAAGIDPRPNPADFATITDGGVSTSTPSGLVDVTYRGAFDPAPAFDLWTKDWTALNAGGILVD